MFNKIIKHSEPLYISSIMVSIIEFTNVLALFLILNTYLLHLTTTLFTTMSFFTIVAVILFIVNTVYFKKNKERICNKYKGESMWINILGYVLYVGYYVGSFILIYVLNTKFGYHL